MPVPRLPVFEILDMRKIDEAFSDSLKTPCNVIPIQDVLLVSSAADPRSVEQAIEILLAAKRPLIAAGDGIFWSGEAAELREFVELTQIPVYARRTG
jgi:thiamine pyrophosphate-dependent acetolactate synthase large subunit-like protein